MAASSIDFSHPKQERFVAAGPAKKMLFLGGKGAGKTLAGCLKMLMLLDKYPNSRGAIVRKQFNHLHSTTLQTLFSILPPSGYTRRNDKYVDLRNGSRIWFVHLDSEDSIGALMGLEINYVFVDQIEEITEDAWNILEARVGRWSHATRLGGWPEDWPYTDDVGNPFPPSYRFASANSPGFDSWVYTRWSEQSPDSEYWRDRGYETIIASSRENKFLGRENLENLLAHDDAWVKRWVDAAWGEVEGRLHEVSNLSLLHYTPELMDAIKNQYRKFRVLDHGESAPTACGWFATDREGNVYVYREYGLAGELVSIHRKNITAMSVGENYDGNLADPSIFAKARGRTATSGPTHSVADEYRDTEILPLSTALYWNPADNNEMGTRNRINEYLAVDPDHIHPVTHAKGAPRLYFVVRSKEHPAGIQQMLVDLRAARRVKITDGVYSDERDPSITDHHYDLVRYFVASRPAIARRPASQKYDVNTWTGYSNYTKRERTRRSRGVGRSQSDY